MDKKEVKEVANELIGWEGNKIFTTVKYLTTRPGQIISEYCQGEKHKYLSPVVYLFGVSGVFLYLQSLSGLDDYVRNPDMIKLYSKLVGSALSSSQLNKFFNAIGNQTLMLLLNLPVNLVVSWFLFRKHNPSFKQSSWFVIYITGQSILFMVPVIMCFWFISTAAFLYASNLLTFMLVVYNIWAAMQFYKIEMGRAILLIFLRLIIMIPFALIVYTAIFLVIQNYF
jgi:hypothetical protein